MAAAVNEQIQGGNYDVALLPAVLGIADATLSQQLKDEVKCDVQFLATLPPSVPGVRVQTLLRKRFIAGGGVHLTGDKAIGGVIEGGTLKCINEVTETVFGLDVNAVEGGHGQWTKYGVYEAQPYMEFGVATDEKLHVKKDGKVINNCYAVGSVLSGHNRVKMADGTGVSMLTALQAVKNILK